MRSVQRSVRLSVPLDTALRRLAERQQMSAYAALQRCVEAGLAALTNPPALEALAQEIATDLAGLSTRMIDAERLLDRTLFTACAAYGYARNAALGARKSDAVIIGEINAAYDRQCRLAREERS